MMGSAMVATVVAALLAGGLWVIVRRAVGASAQRPPGDGDGVASTAGREDVALVYRSEARASQAALVLGVGVSVLMWAWGAWWAQGYGLPISLAGSVGAVVGLVAYAVYPRILWTSDPSAGAVADLTPRRPLSFARQWVFVLPAVAAVVLALGLLLTGLYSAADENGLHRVFQRRSLVGWGVENGQVIDIQYNLSSTGPFPGWYYGVPVMICTVLMILAVYWSLSRTAAAPRPPSAELFRADTALREMRTTFIMSASSSALAFQIAGLSAITGSALRSAHYDAIPTVDLSAPPAGMTPVEPGHTLALTLLLSALPLAVVAAALLARAIATSAAMRSVAQNSRRPLQEPAP
jgi:hypothetical protein